MTTDYESERDKEFNETRLAFESWRRILKSNASDSDKKKATENMAKLIMELETND